MKNKIIGCNFLVLLLLVSCNDDSTSLVNKSGTGLNGTPGVINNGPIIFKPRIPAPPRPGEISIGNGIYIKYFFNSAQKIYPINDPTPIELTLQTPVSDEYVVVGGCVWPYIAGKNAFEDEKGFYNVIESDLTENRPDLDNNAWVSTIASRSGTDKNRYRLRQNNAAIGLRIHGIESSFLRQNMIAVIKNSYSEDSPVAFATLPSGYVMLGGGASVSSGPEAYGSGIVSSYPYNSSSWFAESKALVGYPYNPAKDTDVGTVTSYVIGIRKTINSLGVNYFGELASVIVGNEPIFYPKINNPKRFTYGRISTTYNGVITCPGINNSATTSKAILNSLSFGPRTPYGDFDGLIFFARVNATYDIDYGAGLFRYSGNLTPYGVMIYKEEFD
jgi:hypothetical protein